MLAELAEPLLEWGARGRGPPRALKYPGCTPPGGGEGRRKRGRRPASLQILSPPRPPVPGIAALGPSSCWRRRPEAPAAPEQSVALRVTSPRWGFQSLSAREGKQRKFSFLGGALPFTPTLLSYYLGLSRLESLPLQVLVRISLGPVPPLRRSLPALFSILPSPFPHFCLSPSFCTHLSPPSHLGFLREKVAQRQSPNPTLDHQEPDLSPELHSPFNCLKLRVLESGISILWFQCVSDP